MRILNTLAITKAIRENPPKPSKGNRGYKRAPNYMELLHSLKQAGNPNATEALALLQKCLELNLLQPACLTKPLRSSLNLAAGRIAYQMPVLRRVELLAKEYHAPIATSSVRTAMQAIRDRILALNNALPVWHTLRQEGITLNKVQDNSRLEPLYRPEGTLGNSGFYPFPWVITTESNWLEANPKYRGFPLLFTN